MEEDESRPSKRLSLLLTIAALSSILRLSAAATTDDDDVMAKLAKSLWPAPSGWSGTNPCEWTGVTCDSSGHVTAINLAAKSLSGELPPELNQLSRLKSLFLQHNRLSGAIPPLTNLTSLQQISLESNHFSAVPSPFLVGLASLQTLSLSDNPNLLPWTLPSTLADSTTLTSLYADNSSLFGSIPDIFGSFPNLQNLRLSYNNLTGSLPASFAKSGIQNLWLNNQAQGLSGRVDVLSSMSQLTQVWLHKNQFSGPIPDMSACTSLFDLSLRNNEFTGPVPNSLTTLHKLANVSLENNKLQGPSPNFPKGVLVSLGNTNTFCNPCDSQVTTLLEISGAFGYPMALADSWSGNDPCKGWKSVSCDSNGAVIVLNFGKQGWAGTISPAIANLSALTTLLLNENNLTGSIPPSLTKLAQLKILDVSNNNISGKVPVFSSGVTVNTSGNPFIGKDVESGEGSSSGGMTVGGSGLTTSKSISRWVIGATIAAAVVFLVVSWLVIYKRFVKRRSGKYMCMKGSRSRSEQLKKSGDVCVKGYSGYGSELPSQSSAENSSIQVYDGGNVAIPVQVLREVTNNFSKDNILGQGGFGVVYKGQLPDGTQIAVKRMESTTTASSKGLNEFQAEIAVLSRVRHRHLVTLNGFCVDGNERLLVYEYMPQGTLGQHLFRYRELGLSPLTWKKRVTIVLDVARGVEYLHSLAQQSFIHRDLKPSNILLGDDMRAKVSDFGLVRNAPDGKYSVETRLAGTFGYLAPEYAATGKVTTKVDVFAFGVVLMEIITGRKALDDTLPDEESHLVSWFRRLLNNRNSIGKSLDPSLDPDEETFESICKVAELAGHCTAREPLQRPDMGHVVNVLSPLVDQWKPATRDEEDSFDMDHHMSLPQALHKWQSSENTRPQ
ncbi:receptor-like kinase TMK4 [Actinidia eriantha]|uniref:receptor-like kinase TMK4 n=1 Tax=Actinidia eriantha TaxID=165200 RepID=UPI002586FA5E|nr:receptor-like kinase TMK4 [Actinidia eriantha]